MASIPVPDASSSAYTIQPGTGYDGVVRVSTGTLLPRGRHVLTAAHVVEDVVLAGLRVFLSLPGLAPSLPATAVTLHPAYEAAGANNDLAIIRLSDPAPVGAERFDIYRGSDEVGREVTLVGYGAPATGATGLSSGSETPTRRGGTNRIDAGTDALKGQPQARGSAGGSIRAGSWRSTSTTGPQRTMPWAGCSASTASGAARRRSSSAPATAAARC